MLNRSILFEEGGLHDSTQIRFVFVLFLVYTPCSAVENESSSKK